MWRQRLAQTFAGMIPLLLLLAAAVGYYLYTMREASYLSERNLRHLTTLSKRIGDQLTTYRRVLATAAVQDHPLESFPVPGPLRVELDPYAEGVTFQGKPVPIIFSRLINGDHWFSFVTDSKAGKLSARLRVEDLVSPLLDAGEFDKILLASGNGQVLYQTGQRDLQIVSMDGLSGPGGKELDPPRLRRASYTSEIEVSGQRYKLFVQPIAVIGKEESFGYPQGTEGWLLCGLVEVGTFDLEALSLPSLWILVLVVLFCLTVLGVPFLKLFYMGAEERLRAIDGLMLALSTFVTISLLTLLLLDWMAYRGLFREAETQLQVVAGQTRKAFLQEVAAGCTGLDANNTELVGRLRAGAPLENSLPGPESALASYFGVDREGRQTLRWTRHREPPLLDVADRRYFKDIAGGRLWDLPGCQNVAIETLQSWATGELVTVLAKPFEVHQPPGSPFLTGVTWRFPSLNRAALPPGYGFAVFRQDGEVILHSDRRRSGRENLLEEAGRNRKLRSILFAGQPADLRVRYSGGDHFFHLEPIEGVPLWVLSFREASALEGMNTSILITSLVCLLAYTLAFSVLFSLGYLAPSFRARWVWPSEQRRRTYWRLLAFYGLVFAAFTATLRFGALETAGLFWMGILVPPTVLLVSYVKVRHADHLALCRTPAGSGGPPPPAEAQPTDPPLSKARQWRSRALLSVRRACENWRDTKIGVVLTLVLFLLLALRSALALGWIGTFLLAATAAASAAVLFVRLAPRTTETAEIPAPFLPYIFASAVLLAVLAVLPASAFFKLAHDHHTSNLVRHAHLHLLRTLEANEPSRTRVFPHLFPRTTVLTPASGRTCADLRRRNLLGEGSHEASATAGRGWGWLVGALTRVPLYNEAVLQAGSLGEEDYARRWQRHAEHEPGVLLFQERSGEVLCGALSQLPSFRLWSAENRWGFLLLALLFLLALGTMSFISRRILFLGAGVPIWLKSALLGRATVGGNLFVREIENLDRIRTSPEVAVVDLRTEDVRERRDLEGKRRIYVLGFDHRLGDRWVGRDRLAFLEGLVHDGDRIVVVQSAKDPYRALADGSLGDPRNERECRQWEALLQRFETLPRNWRRTSEELNHALGKAESDLEKVAEKLPWYRAFARRRRGLEILQRIQNECQVSIPLQEIGRSLLESPEVLTWSRERLYTEIGERAERHYQFLWSSLSRSEKLALGHLADEGLVNPKNRRALQRLTLRGLVDKDPSIEVMNETFRRFVASPTCQAEVFEIEKGAKESAWMRLRRPLLIGLLGVAAFVFATQREAFDATLLWISLIAAALPQLMKIVGYVGATKPPEPEEA